MKISIITVVRNGASTIRDCIESVRQQSVKAEHIIVDGGSTDETLSIVGEYAEGARLVSEPDQGIYDAMNKGLFLATGDVVGLLNADDFYACPEVLTKVAALFADESIDSCYGDLVYVKERETGNGERSAGDKFQVVRYWQSGEYDCSRFIWGWMPPHPTFFVRRGIYEKFGTFNTELGTAADYELMLRFLVRYRISSAYIPEVLVKMRTGGASNISLTNRLRANRMDRLAWEVNGLEPRLWTLIMKPLSKILQYLRKP